jgi:hypothetical protein
MFPQFFSSPDNHTVYGGGTINMSDYDIKPSAYHYDDDKSG